MTNEMSSFEDIFFDTFNEFSRNHTTSRRVAHFLNSANDVVYSKKTHVFTNIKHVLHGSANYLSTISVNHNRKNVRTQIIVFNSIVSIRFYVIDVVILVKVGVMYELLRINDRESDKLVLDLSSFQIREKIMESGSSDYEHRTILVLTILLARAHLFAANLKENGVIKIMFDFYGCP